MTGSMDRPRPSSRLAVGGLVCGVLSLLVAWTGIGLLLAVPAFVLSGFALARAREDPPRALQPRLAIIGMILGGLGAVLSAGTMYQSMPAARTLKFSAARIDDENNLRVLFETLQAYATDNDDRLPANLATLLVPHRYLVKTGTLVSGWTQTAPLQVPPGLEDPAQLEPVLDDHADFVFSAPRVVMHNIRQPEEMVLVYSRTTYGGRGRLVLFLDGHAEWVPAERIGEVSQLSDAARADAQLPPAPLPAVKRE